MAGEVYISGVYQNGEIGDKLGAKTKWRGEHWPADSFKHPRKPKWASDAVQKAGRGEKLEDDQFPEAVAVWNEKAFAKAGGFIHLSGFLTVNEKVAAILRQFDLGEGGLVPVPLVKADLETPWPEPYYYINYGGPKDAFLPEESENVEVLLSRKPPDKSVYDIGWSVADEEIALTNGAIKGADIWIDRFVWHRLFLSGQLVDALRVGKFAVELRLKKCRVVLR